MPATLDHLTVIAPTLEAGAAHVRQQLGLPMEPGGKHPEMGTHNLLLRLGLDVFLEVIAVDPQAPAPPWPRWFGLDNSAAVQADWDAGRRLRAWVARSGDLDGLLAVHGALLGARRQVSRGERAWWFSVRDDGALPMDGAVPPLIDWGPRGTPAPAMPPSGAGLTRLVLEHPEPQRIAAQYAELGLVDAPQVRHGVQLRYLAQIQTPDGLKLLS